MSGEQVLESSEMPESNLNKHNFWWHFVWLRTMSSLHRSGWVSLVSISLGGEYLFRFEISKPADEFDIHRPQAPRPAYLFYRPSLRWDWSCFVADSGLRGEQRTLPHLGCLMLTPSVCLLEHLWLSCAVAQWGIKTQLCSRRKIFKGSECPMMYP